jgi:hypothetical protein
VGVCSSKRECYRVSLLLPLRTTSTAVNERWNSVLHSNSSGCPTASQRYAADAQAARQRSNTCFGRCRLSQGVYYLRLKAWQVVVSCTALLPKGSACFRRCKHYIAVQALHRSVTTSEAAVCSRMCIAWRITRCQVARLTRPVSVRVLVHGPELLAPQQLSHT